MSASFQWSESNGSEETVTDDISNVNFGSDDSPNLDPATYPIVAGENSFQKYIRAKFTDVVGEITNMKFWKSAGDYKTGEEIIGSANATYEQPTTTKATTDSAVPTEVGSAWDITSTEDDPTKITTDGYTKYMRLQLTTTSSTPSGAVNTKTFTFQYDEA